MRVLCVDLWGQIPPPRLWIFSFSLFRHMYFIHYLLFGLDILELQKKTIKDAGKKKNAKNAKMQLQICTDNTKKKNPDKRF